MKGVIVILACVLGYLSASLVQTVLHRIFGHGRLGGWIKMLHVGEHHTIYSGDQMASAHYAEEKSLSIYYVLPSILGTAAAFYLLPLSFAIPYIGAAMFSYLAHIVLHEHYHLEITPLEKHGWFRKLRALHVVHHLEQNRNYAVIDLFWDKLMGTFAPATSADTSQRST